MEIVFEDFQVLFSIESTETIVSFEHAVDVVPFIGLFFLNGIALLTQTIELLLFNHGLSSNVEEGTAQHKRNCA